MTEYKLEIKQIVDYPKCRIYRQFIQLSLIHICGPFRPIPSEVPGKGWAGCFSAWFKYLLVDRAAR